jgi:hypothetical protein
VVGAARANHFCGTHSWRAQTTSIPHRAIKLSRYL